MPNSPIAPKKQAIRKQRVLMTVGSYIGTSIIIGVACSMDYLSFAYLAFFMIATILINGTFYLIFHFNLNGKIRDPDLTLWQMLGSLPPHYFVMLFMDNNQARNALLFVSLIPLLYGILGLNTRRFLLAAFVNLTGYLFTLFLIQQNNPGLINWPAEFVMLAALIVVMIQMPLIGGYISQLRHSLKKKNNALKQAFETISEIANKDELTGIRNRRYVVEQVAEEYGRCLRGTKTFTVIMFDLDYFKNVNDTFGHLIGDAVLRRTSEACQNTLRQSDCLGRYGGEEFLLVLPHTDLEGGLFKAEQLRQKIEELDFSDLASELKVTISAGVATFNGKESYWDTIDRADKALYQSKRTGRNRVSKEIISD